MSHNLRPTPASPSSASSASPFVRAASLPLVLVVAVALAAAMLAALQLRSVEQDHLPALEHAQQLDATAAVTAVALRRVDLVGADSLADRFHVVAGAPHGSEAMQSRMRSYDASFVDYYVSARRVAQGTSMSDDADLSSEESAKLARGVLSERLVAGMAADRAIVESTSISAMRMRIAVCVLFAVAAGIALLLLRPRRRASLVRVTDAPMPMPIQAPVKPMEREDEPGHLQEAVRRMAARRKAVANATAQVAERNRQQVALLEAPQAAPALTVIRGDSRVLRTRVTTSTTLGKRALAGV